MIRITHFVPAMMLMALWPLGLLAEGAQPDITLNGHKAAVIAAGFSPDGKKLASVSDDGQLKLWDIDSKKELLSADGMRNSSNKIRFTPDGKSMVTLGSSNAVLVFDAGTGTLQRTIPVKEMPGGPQSLDLSPDGKTIAIVGRGALRLIDLAGGVAKYAYEVHAQYAVSDVAFSPDGTRIATAANDNTALVLDPISGKIVRTFPLKQKGKAAVFTRDGKSLLVYTDDQVIQSFDIAGGEAKKLVDQNVPFFTLDVSSDGTTLVLGGAGRGPWLVSLADGKLTNDAFTSDDRLKSTAISPDGKLIAGGANEGAIYLWKVPK